MTDSYIGKVPVCVKEWCEVMEYNSYSDGIEKLPRLDVSWKKFKGLSEILTR